jgi:hypothetical protein
MYDALTAHGTPCELIELTRLDNDLSKEAIAKTAEWLTALSKQKFHSDGTDE